MVDDVPVELLAFLPAGTSQKIALEDFATQEFLNVKNFGPPTMGNGGDTKGDGSYDTDYIQACLDAAFGSYTSPHGTTTPNKNVYLPRGNYNVRSKWTRTVASTANVGGEVRVTLNATVTVGELNTGDMLTVLGVTGTLGANGTWGVTRVNSTQFILKGSVFDSASTNSTGTAVPPALRLRQIASGRIYGSSRYSSGITCGTAGAALLSINGATGLVIENLGFGSAICLDVNYSPQVGDAITAASGCGISYCSISGSVAAVAIGWGGYPCFGNVILNTYLYGSSGLGEGVAVKTAGSSANFILGGNIADATAGVHIYNGGCNSINSSVQNGYAGPTAAANIDFVVDNAVTDPIFVAAMRSESFNLLKVGPACTAPITVTGCGMVQVGRTFFRGGGKVSFNGCGTGNGTIIGEGGSLILNNTVPGSYDPASTFAFLQTTPMLVTTQTGTAYTIKDTDGGSKIRFNNAAATTVTINGSTLNLGPGSRIEVQAVNTGKVSFVTSGGATLRASLSGATPQNALRAQWSNAVLVCDAADVWTLTGDCST